MTAAYYDAQLKGAWDVILLPAVFADSIDLKSVACREVVVFVADLLLELPYFRREELDGTTAIGADHVVMTAPIVLMLVAGNAVVEGDFAGQAALRQQLQSAVDGGVADAGIFFLHHAMKFIGGKMVASFEEGVQNCVALRGLLQADVFEMAMKDLLGFADHLAGDGGLIIDALLQHGGWNRVRIPSGILKMKFIFSGARGRVEYNQRFP